MTDEPQHGLGGIPSPDDSRDFPIASLYALMGAEVLATPPASYIVPGPYSPVLNQGSSPMCVAFSSSTLKAYEDLRDQGAIDFDEPTFFANIGGTPNGAVIRDAFSRMLNWGYPVVASGNEAQHKIAAYYAVPVAIVDLKSAILTFGPVLVGMPWYNSWFRPVNGVLPAPAGGLAGGHAIAAIGWDSRGLRLRNSWGTGWGFSGDCFLPWTSLSYVREAWKAVDVIEKSPPGPPVPAGAVGWYSFAKVARLWTSSGSPLVLRPVTNGTAGFTFGGWVGPLLTKKSAPGPRSTKVTTSQFRQILGQPHKGLWYRVSDAGETGHPLP